MTGEGGMMTGTGDGMMSFGRSGDGHGRLRIAVEGTMKSGVRMKRMSDAVQKLGISVRRRSGRKRRRGAGTKR